jgi:glycerol-3-phosphate acyltransferase PlsY
MLASVLVVVAYLCGSVPTGLWVGRQVGVDVRSRGSRNIGATNVARTAGMRPALLTLGVDIAKGLGPVLLARWLLADPRQIASVGLAAFGGHVFSVFLRFAGGKGVATAFGVFLGMAPEVAGLSLIVFAAVAFSTRYVSVASIVAALALPPAAVALGYAPAVRGAALVVAAIIVARHRDNLSRLRRGVEPKFEVRRTP